MSSRKRRRRPPVDPRLALQARKCIKELKLVLFCLTSQASIDSVDRMSRAQIEKYGGLGLRSVPVEEMPQAVDRLFARFEFRRGERLLEIGPGSHGGIALIAALLGLDVVVVEYDRPFLVDVDLLKAQLSSTPGSQAALAPIAALSGSVEVSLIETLRRVIHSYEPLVSAVGGSIRLVPGDFSATSIQDQASDFAPIDHVICTDVMSPMEQAFSSTTAMLTTGSDQKITSMIHGLARVAAHARSLFISLIVPEQSADYGAPISRIYGALESALSLDGRTARYEEVISPSSGTVLRSRLYEFTAPA
jgi:hypothetical protein